MSIPNRNSEAGLRVRPIREIDRPAVARLLLDRWGRPGIVSRGRMHPAHTYSGFIAWTEGGIAGLLTFRIRGGRCEVISLDSLREGRGIGTRLLAAAARHARLSGCRELWLVTSNDNLGALRFYQRRGLLLRRIHAGAIDRISRRMKPSIPRTGLYGIPLRDEIELYKPLTTSSRTGRR